MHTIFSGSIQDLQQRLAAQHYVADHGLAVSLFLALRLGRPLFLEGEAGVGKTALAAAVAAALDTDLIRLQCYEGSTSRTRSTSGTTRGSCSSCASSRPPGELDRAGARRELYSEAFLIKRPLLQAIDPARTRPAVLLIDEIDRADEEFEGYLLELLAEFQITIPELGTVRAAEPPLVILTSNRTREVHDALKRRCLYQWIEYPAFEKELAIVASARAARVGAACGAGHRARAGAARPWSCTRCPASRRRSTGWRRWWRSTATRSTRTLVEATLGVVLKAKDDIDAVRGETLASLLARAASR